jgi:hypothetical protein
MSEVTIIRIPQGFKIRKKSDVEVFINKCMCKGDYYIITDTGIQYIFTKKKDEVSVYERIGNLYDPFNPSLEIANTKNNCYKKTVADCVWENRKYINAKWFGKER